MQMRKWIRVAAVVSALIGALTVAAPARAASTKYITPLYSAATGSLSKCATVRGGLPVKGAPLVIGDCKTGNANAWYWFGDNDFSTRSALDWPDGMCVGLANRGSTANGTPLIIWDCHLHPDQQWEYRRLSNGNYAWVNPPSGKCVGLANRGSTANGTPLIIWDCHLHPDQQWRMTATPSTFGLR